LGRLVYTLNVSLDGYVETADRSLDWATVDDELHSWFNDHHRALDASLYGRRLYELMNAHWPNAHADPDATDVMLEYAQIWNATPKVVFSRSLDRVEGNARLARGDIRDELGRLREEFPGVLEVGGATLAASFIREGLVDEFCMVVHPVAIGGGTPYWPADMPRATLRLIETIRFDSGVVALRYSAR
jgi:dihydrofolate reductase